MKLHLVASLIIVLFVIIYLIIFTKKNIETFAINRMRGFRSCGDCNTVGKKGIDKCLSCTNCGWCIDPNGYGSCVQGDFTGPYFADCTQFMFGGGLTVGGPGSGQGGVNSSLTATPFTVSLAGAMQNPSPSPFGNTFYQTDAPLRSARRWRPPGDYRDYYD